MSVGWVDRVLGTVRVVKFNMGERRDVYVRPSSVRAIQALWDFNGIGDDCCLLTVDGCPTAIQVNEPLEAVLRKLDMFEGDGA